MERLDDGRWLGTHNSYHLRPDRELMPGDEADYAHPPLDQQLDQGIRALELDFYDGPGLPVFHSIITDVGSSCPTLPACLDTIDAWSRDHPKAEPLVLFIEPKVLPTSEDPAVQQVITNAAAEQGLTDTDAAGLERIDELLRDTFGKRLITPDQVRGKHPTLRDAVRSGKGWPLLSKARGKVLAVLIGEQSTRDLYKQGTPSLEGKAMFVNSHNSEPSAAVISADVPVPDRFRRLVAQHFLVKTRADANGIEARANDHTRADLALASGAQIIMTDYPVPDPAIGPYVVTLP